MNNLDKRLGLLSALPITLVLALSFLAPLFVVAVFSVMPSKVFIFADFQHICCFHKVITNLAGPCLWL